MTGGHAGTARLYLLDGFRLEAPDGTPAVVPRGLQRLLALIGLRSAANRAYLAGMLWPDTSEAHARCSLRTDLWRLGRCVAGMVQIRGETVALGDEVGVDVDDLVRAAAHVKAGGDPADASVLLSTGPDDLLPGWYDDWVLIERERLRQLRLHALEDMARSYLSVQQHGDAIQAALMAVRIEPLRESPHRLIVEAHLAEGNAYEAVHTFYVYRDLLLRELGIEPSAQMQEQLGHILGQLRGRHHQGGRFAERTAPLGRQLPELACTDGAS